MRDKGTYTMTMAGKHKVSAKYEARQYGDFRQVHIEFRGEAISETGYRSEFVFQNEIEEFRRDPRSYIRKRAEELYRLQQEEIRKRLFRKDVRDYPTLFEFTRKGGEIRISEKRAGA